VTEALMRNVSTMIQRELGAYFLSPIAYAVMTIFLFSSGLAFGLGTFRPGGEASLRSLFDSWMLLILVFVLPMLTMRLLSEEFRSGTIETLVTVPITEIEIVLGKFLGVLAVYGILLVTLLVYPIVLAVYGPVDVALLVCNFVGLLLLGALYISVGLFFSSCTRHQMIAVLLSFALLALMTFATHGLAQVVGSGWIRVVLQHVSVRSHFHDFVRGLVDVNHVVFFLTTSGLFLFLTVKRLEMRRW
jgi:ABC-2 type transport system permease protein